MVQKSEKFLPLPVYTLLSLSAGVDGISRYNCLVKTQGKYYNLIYVLTHAAQNTYIYIHIHIHIHIRLNLEMYDLYRWRHELSSSKYTGTRLLKLYTQYI